jgi:hypothetical protein
MKYIFHLLLIAGFVVALDSCSDDDKVVKDSNVPTSSEFSWNGNKIELDKANNWSMTAYNNVVAITNVATKEQSILSWTGGLTLGDKTNGKLEVVGGNAITLSSIKVVKAESNTYHITFEGDSKNGWIYFTR